MGAGTPEEPDDRIAQTRHHLGSSTGPHLAAVLIEDDISHPMHLIFNAPVTSAQPEQACRAGLLRNQTGDGVGPFPCRYPLWVRVRSRQQTCHR